MTLRVFASVAIALALCSSAAARAQAPSIELMNLRGDVSYRHATGAAVSAAPGVMTPLAPNDSVTVGENALGAIVLPGSSAMLLSAQSTIRLSSATNASSSFDLLAGAARFRIAQDTNLALQTSGGQVVVRGGFGEVYETASQLQILCYSLTDTSAPIEVDLRDGKHVQLAARQALTATLSGSTVASAEVSDISDAMIATSNDTFGPAPIAPAAHGSGAGWAIGGVVAAAAIGTAIALSKGHSSSSGSGPSPSGTIALSPRGPFNFGSPTGAPATFKASESGYSGSFTATAADPSIVRITQSSNSYTVAPRGPGRTTITVSDSRGNSAHAQVNVASASVVLSPAGPFDFGSPSGTKTLRASEVGYSGPFTATISGVSGIATVSGTHRITITAIGIGTTSVAVRDSFGNSANAAVNVASGKINVSPPGPFRFASKLAGPQSFSVSETGYTRTFTATPVKAGIVRIGGSSPFTISPVGTGSTAIKVKDSFGNEARIEASVASGQITLTPTGPFTFASPSSPAQAFRAHEDGYSGIFSAKPSQSGIVTIIGSSPFTIKPVATGSTGITVSDSLGNSISTSATVGSKRKDARPTPRPMPPCETSPIERMPERMRPYLPPTTCPPPGSSTVHPPIRSPSTPRPVITPFPQMYPFGAQRLPPP